MAQLYPPQTNFEFDIAEENKRCANFSGVHFGPRTYVGNNETPNMEGRDARSWRVNRPIRCYKYKDSVDNIDTVQRI